ncbi:cyanophycinase [Micromonospora pattaloongensis]|uniref:Cyanophycinase n=1 Tax=Micromonospora pattaloongensis TaxID=405436 RepID=A0A1H3RW56_9ACTN|nr:cyanophycinase [Micromonospora pattaloongensis]SDZ29501.1 cyanophycinase [Micromonospora pattaloongensis]
MALGGSGSERGPGRVVAIGGAERSRAGGDAILRRFVELSGGAAGRVVVVATASSEPDVVEANYLGLLTAMGAGQVRALRLETRDQANADDAVQALIEATGVFFTGGDQARVAEMLRGTRVDSVLHTRLGTGELTLAGTSAGAAMMSGTMIIDGGREGGIAARSVRIAAGLQFLPGVLIDMHFAERGRLDRLLSAVALYPHALGLGIDEDTAIVAEGSRFEVIGTGGVTVIDGGCATTIRTAEYDGKPPAMLGVCLHVMPAGYSFDLDGRRPLVATSPGKHREVM